MGVPLFYLRGTVYLVRFASSEDSKDIINKYAICLQQGDIVQKRKRFVGVLTTSCKDSNEPNLFPWSVYIDPDESKSKYGVVANCSEIHTFLWRDVIDGPMYHLSEKTMKKIDYGLQFGTGWLNLEDLRRRLEEESKDANRP